MSDYDKSLMQQHWEKLEAENKRLRSLLRESSCLACEKHNVLYQPKNGCSLCKIDELRKAWEVLRDWVDYFAEFPDLVPPDSFLWLLKRGILAVRPDLAATEKT